MPAAEYSVTLTSPLGYRRAALDNNQITRLEYTRVANAPGVMTLLVPRDSLEDDDCIEDARFEIWRKPDGGLPRMEGETPFLLVSEERGVDNTGRYRRIVAESALTLLKRRRIASLTGSAGAGKTGAADDVIKAFVRESIGSGAGTVSVWPHAGTVPRSWAASIQVQADVTDALSITKDGVSYRELLATIQEVARDATAQAPTAPVFFDIVWVSSMLEFRTYYGFRGQNRIGTYGGNVVLSPDRNSLASAKLLTDFRNTVTFAYALGSGQREARSIDYAGDYDRMVASTWGLREGAIDATKATTTSLREEAVAEVQRRRPVRTLTGDVVSTDGAVYGVDWDFGDRLTAEFENQSFTAHVNSLTVTLDRGHETIKATVTGEQFA